MLGGKFTRAAASAPSFQSGRPWSWDVVSASYQSAGIADLRQLSIGVDNQLVGHHTLSTARTPYRIKREGAQRITVEGTFLLSDQALFQEFLAQTEKRLLVTFTGQDIGPAEQAVLSVELPRLRFGEMAPQLSGPGQVEVSFSAAALYDAGSGYALRATLTNTQPAY